MFKPTHMAGFQKTNGEPTSVGQKAWSESHGQVSQVTWTIWGTALTWETSISSFLCQVDTNLNLPSVASSSRFRNTNWKMKIREQGGCHPRL